METSLVGDVQLIVRKDMHLKWPRAETPTHYITMGLHEDLTVATKMALREMIDFLVSEKHLSRDARLHAFQRRRGSVDHRARRREQGRARHDREGDFQVGRGHVARASGPAAVGHLVRPHSTVATNEWPDWKPEVRRRRAALRIYSCSS